MPATVIPLPTERPASGGARQPGRVTRTERDGVTTRSPEALSGEPVPGVGTTRLRRNACCEAPVGRGDTRTRLGDENRKVPRFVVTDPEACVHPRAREADREDADRGSPVRDRIRRNDDGRHIRDCCPRTLVLASGDFHPQTKAQIGDADAVRPARGSDHGRAGQGINVATLPLEGEGSRAACPRALGCGELLSNTSLAGDRGPGGCW